MFADEFRSYIEATRHWQWLEIERLVVVDPHMVAGTPDRIGMYRGRGRPKIADLKTGASVEHSMGAIAVQLAIYAHANAIYDNGERLPMPDVDLERAVVIHLPVGAGTCTLYEVDIAAGWEAFQLAMTVRDWRKRRDLHREMPSEAPQLPSAPFEGGDEPAEVAQHLKAVYGRLDGEEKAWVTALGADAHRGGVSFRLFGVGGIVTERRVALMTSVIELARHGYANDDTVRGLCEATFGDLAHFANVSAGRLVGSLDADQAHEFANRVGDLIA